MTYEIKIARSRKLAPYVPSTQDKIDASITAYLVQHLTAKELAEVRRCLNAHWHKARAFAEREILNAGVIYDPQIGIREIAPYARAWMEQRRASRQPRAKVLRPCPYCAQSFGAVDLRQHVPVCPERKASDLKGRSRCC